MANWVADALDTGEMGQREVVLQRMGHEGGIGSSGIRRPKMEIRAAEGEY